MAKYKLVEMADMDKTGSRKVYPKMVAYRTLSTEEFIKKMKWYNNALPTSAIEAALSDMCNILARMLAMGYNVNLDGLGTFSLSLGFEDEKPIEMQQDDDKMTYRKVGVKNVNFKTSPELIKEVRLLANSDLERDMGGVKVIKRELYSKEERVSRALEEIHENGFITLTDYAAINHLSRTAASMELKTLTDDPSSPITAKGRGSHKVWVKKQEE